MQLFFWGRGGGHVRRESFHSATWDAYYLKLSDCCWYIARVIVPYDKKIGKIGTISCSLCTLAGICSWLPRNHALSKSLRRVLCKGLFVTMLLVVMSSIPAAVRAGISHNLWWIAISHSAGTACKVHKRALHALGPGSAAHYCFIYEASFIQIS